MEITTILFWIAFGLGALLIITGVVVAVLTLIGVTLSLIFLKTRKIIIPGVTLFIMNVVGEPIKYLLYIIGVEGDMVSRMIIDVRNRIYKKQYSNTKYSERMIFIPQCLRSPKCPAPLNAEGIQCINCGRCGVGQIIAEAEQLGTRVFIAPGSSLIKRMVKKHKPKAVLGVGCPMEVKEGTEMIAASGLPVQGVRLSRDGCVNTRVDILKLLTAIRTGPKDDDHPSEELIKRAREIAEKWDVETPPIEVVKGKIRDK